MLTEVIFCAAAKYPREACNTTYAASVRSKIGDSGSKKNERPQSAFAAFEVQYEVSKKLVGAEAEQFQIGPSAYGLGHGVGFVVGPHEFDAGIVTGQEACVDPVVNTVPHLEAIVTGRREIQSTVDLSADEGRDFDAPLGQRRRCGNNGPSKRCP